MSPLAKLRRAPSISAAVLLALAVGLAAPVAYALGVRQWPPVVGFAAVLFLAFAGLARLRPRPPLPRPHPAATSPRYRVVPSGKGSGRPHDDHTTDDDGEKPRWLM